MDSNSNSDSFNTPESGPNSKKKVFKRKHKVKSGMVAKASDDVQNSQTWSQTALQYENINKSVAFQDHDFKFFVAGELEIISLRRIKIDERNTRLSLLTKIVYYSNIYQWKALLDFYAAFFRQIDTGVKTWKDNPGDLEAPLLSKYVKQDYSKKTSSSFKQDSKTPIAWYCAFFQQHECSKASPHKIVIRGVERGVNHVCATCYRMDKIKSQHLECSSVCPHNNERLQQVFEVDNLEKVLWKTKHSVKCEFCLDCSLSKDNLINYIEIHNKIKGFGLYNFQNCRIPVFSRLNVSYIRQKLVNYSNYQVCDFLEYGWPVVHNGISIRSSSCRNHTGATDFPEQITRYLIKEASYQAVVGPSKDNPF